jgi:NifU-like protein involved in Fe-S cluster formation
MTQLDEIYSSRILEVAGNIPRTKRLESPAATATAHSKLCGSTISVDLEMENGKITGFGQDVKACLLGQASASIVASHVIGATGEEMKEIGETMRKMLKQNGPPPTGKWKDLEILQPVRDFKARHASTLLIFDAIEDAIDQIEVQDRTTGIIDNSG